MVIGRIAIPQCSGLLENSTAPLRNEVHVELLNGASSLGAHLNGAHLNGEISPASLAKECGHTVVRLGCFLGCEGEIAEIGSLL